jgi:hypothetical protein
MAINELLALGPFPNPGDVSWRSIVGESVSAQTISAVESVKTTAVEATNAALTAPDYQILFSAGLGTQLTVVPTTTNSMQLTVPDTSAYSGGSANIQLAWAGQVANLTSTSTYTPSTPNALVSMGVGISTGIKCGPSGIIRSSSTTSVAMLSGGPTTKGYVQLYLNTSNVPSSGTSVGGDVAGGAISVVTASQTTGVVQLNVAAFDGGCWSGLTPGVTYYPYIAVATTVSNEVEFGGTSLSQPNTSITALTI